jgi:hypothetical protein
MALALDYDAALGSGCCQRCESPGATACAIRRRDAPGQWARLYLCASCAADAESRPAYVVIRAVACANFRKIARRELPGVG